MTSELGRPGTELDHIMFQSIPGESDVLDILDAHLDLPEAPQPALIRSLLKNGGKAPLAVVTQLTVTDSYATTSLTEVDDIASYDIVISTYDTVRADWGGGQKATDSFLFSILWKRIILDEAHVIRNTKSQVSQAICALEASARWAVTGTPIQNRIGDLAALLKFIRAYPYHDVKQFESDISQLWKTENIEEAVNRLKKLSGGLVLRRPKTAIELPPRTDLKFPIKFRTTERELYDKVKHQTMAKIEEAFQDGDSGGLGSSSYIAVMQRINALRMICDLGLNYDSRHHLTAAEDTQSSEFKDWHTIAQETFNLHHEISPVVCSGCASACDTTAKVVALVGQLKALPVDTKSWRMTLNLVEMGLKEAGISYVRFDGKVRQRDRQAVIKKFRKDPTVQVFLLTLSCGAVGNPTVEEQALARIYRIGQQKEVTTVRFFVEDTFEEVAIKNDT
ncbi:hypothetical protein NEMBOFW57_004497 [Staphylotrichum longicolle]|uniref:Helicase ATP-binding domain-containing protein n=1 Tax=Staphylotrichum longicolle TaxID=669026 RepID=A0AAD4F7I8_9PEZI|nr:hypothetical protein NEMBOFW57_004497 [Staphylotrichum longicolle]